MKFFSKALIALLLLVTTTSALAYFLWYKPKFSLHAPGHSFVFNKGDDNRVTILRLKQKAVSVKDFARANNYNANRCFLIDMRIPSGQKRFFVYNLEKDSVEMAGLVAHGSGSGMGGDDLYFSSTPNSNCTALVKYRIGKS